MDEPDRSLWPRALDRRPGPGECRFCGAALRHTVVDLGVSPLCESYVPPERQNEMEPFYPLHVRVCQVCFLVQLEEYVSGEAIFSDYAYFSSYSDSWLAHCERYVETMTGRLGLGPRSHVVEVASNDGYLLQYFVARGIPCLGVEPAANVARVATERGVPTRVCFFGRETARELARERRADLLLGANVLAQVHDVNDFVAGLRILLAEQGVLTIEFPHVISLVSGNQFDTIYHEHFSYFSLHSAERILEAQGLRVFDVDELPTHGGSLRIHACHVERAPKGSAALARVREREQEAGVATLAWYAGFQEQVQETKRSLLELLIRARRDGRRVVGYGAPGKGNTLLNYCGIRTDFVEFTVDRNPHKQGRFLPGTRIPVLHPDRLREARPDYVLVLPWNLREEILAQLAFVRDWGGRFILPIPTPRVEP